MLRSHRATSREGESWVGEEGRVTVKKIQRVKGEALQQKLRHALTQSGCGWAQGKVMLVEGKGTRK